jgi:hypothetical protein
MALCDNKPDDGIGNKTKFGKDVRANKGDDSSSGELLQLALAAFSIQNHSSKTSKTGNPILDLAQYYFIPH